jgi:hypothetical protein
MFIKYVIILNKINVYFVRSTLSYMSFTCIAIIDTNIKTVILMKRAIGTSEFEADTRTSVTPLPMWILTVKFGQLSLKVSRQKFVCKITFFS